MMYRDDVEALAARHQQLEAEVQTRIRERDDVGHMLAEARDRDAEERRIADLIADGPRKRRRRRRLRIAAIALALAGIVTGGAVIYRKHIVSAREARIEDAIATMRGFTVDMCKCTSTDCAQHVSDEMTKWGQRMVKEMGEPVDPKPTEEQIKRMVEIGERMGKCMQRAMGAMGANN